MATNSDRGNLMGGSLNATAHAPPRGPAVRVEDHCERRLRHVATAQMLWTPAATAQMLWTPAATAQMLWTPAATAQMLWTPAATAETTDSWTAGGRSHMGHGLLVCTLRTRRPRSW